MHDEGQKGSNSERAGLLGKVNGTRREAVYVVNGRVNDMTAKNKTETSKGEGSCGGWHLQTTIAER